MCIELYFEETYVCESICKKFSLLPERDPLLPGSPGGHELLQDHPVQHAGVVPGAGGDGVQVAEPVGGARVPVARGRGGGEAQGPGVLGEEMLLLLLWLLLLRGGGPVDGREGTVGDVLKLEKFGFFASFDTTKQVYLSFRTSKSSVSLLFPSSTTSASSPEAGAATLSSSPFCPSSADVTEVEAAEAVASSSSSPTEDSLPPYPLSTLPRWFLFLLRRVASSSSCSRHENSPRNQ